MASRSKQALIDAKFLAARTVIHIETYRTREHADPSIARRMRWVRTLISSTVGRTHV